MSDQPKAPDTRSICPACGYILQAVGVILLLGTCCWWPFTSFTQDEIKSSDPARSVPSFFADASPAQKWMVVGMSISFLSGLTFMVVGLGVQHQRRKSAKAALFIATLVGLFFWVYLGWTIFAAPAAARIITTGVLAILWTGLFLLTGAAAEELKRSPPLTDSESSLSSADEAELRRDLLPPRPE